MKKIMKKNQVIITSLAILIAVAGYLNFADVDLGFKDKETSTDSSSILDDVDYDLTDETALLDENGADGTTQSEVMDTASPGEAVDVYKRQSLSYTSTIPPATTLSPSFMRKARPLRFPANITQLNVPVSSFREK